eukprot:scaffold3398_cov189-Skeletonema_marinoi.AAC.1
MINWRHGGRNDNRVPRNHFRLVRDLIDGGRVVKRGTRLKNIVAAKVVVVQLLLLLLQQQLLLLL